jgi:hypothetical protein
MNLLQISLTNCCNLSCDYCPVAQWSNKPEYPNTLRNEALIPFLSERIKPQEWHIELTGGEPAFYEGLPVLLSWLNESGYKGLVKTNGMLPIPHTPNFKRVAAFHRLETPPAYFDEILIIKKKGDEKAYMEKVLTCESRCWPYKAIDYCKPGGLLYGRFKHHYDKMLFITPDGKLRECNADRRTETVIPGWTEPKKICEACKTACDFEIFMEGK